MITITDFWRLVWQEKVRTIAMVTNVKEGKTKKCEQYWPAESGSGQSYGPFNVTVVEQHIFADYTIRTIQLVVSKMISYLEFCVMFVFIEKGLALHMTIVKLGFQLELYNSRKTFIVYISVLSYTVYTH